MVKTKQEHKSVVNVTPKRDGFVHIMVVNNKKGATLCRVTP